MAFVTQADFEKACSDAGAVGGVEMTVLGPTGYYSDQSKMGFMTSASVGERVGPHGDAILPEQLAAIEAGLKDGKFGAIKLYLGYVWKSINDPFYEPIFALAEKYDVPIVCHTGDTFSADVREYLQEPFMYAWNYIQDPGKIMFATDWPLMSMKETAQAYMEVIPQEHWNAFFHNNAMRVYKKMKPLDALPTPTPDDNPDHPNARP